jgi:hypothetical protein
MASEILGLFTSPEMYQQQQDLMMQRQAAELAQLDPYQNIRYGAIRAGQQFGRGLAGLLGAEDPQLRMISARQSVLGNIDLGNPDSILAAARQLANSGDQQGALALADYARKAQADAALVAQRQREGRAAAVPKELQIAGARAELQSQIKALKAEPASPERDAKLEQAEFTLAGLPIKAEGLVREQQIARDFALAAGEEGSEAYKKAYIDKLGKLTSNETQSKLGEFERVMNARYPDTPENAAARNALMDAFLKGETEGRAKGKGTTVSVGGISVDTGKASETAGKLIGAELVDVKGKESALDSIANARDLLKQGIYAGAFGPEKKFIAKYIGVGDPEKVARTEQFVSDIGEIVIPRLKDFGGQDSNQELKYLTDVMGGNIRLEPTSLARILESADRKIKRGIERLRRQAESGEKKQTLTSTLPPPAEAAPAAPAAPARAPRRVKFGDLPN